MGQCTAKTKKKTQKYTDEYWREPEDTEKLANVALPKLSFEGTLGNFKIINCDYPSVSIKLQIKEVDSFLLRSKKINKDKSANWTFEHKFQFQMTEYSLRKSFVQIFVQGPNEEVIGQMKVNLYLISSGPYHQNFAISLKKSQNTRIFFDLKISQIIEIELKSIQAQIDLFTKHPGEKFNYSIKPIVGHNIALNVSENSYTVKVKLDNKQNIESSNQEIIHKSRRFSSRNAEKLIQEGKNLIWTKSDGLPMPSIIMETLVSQLHHCYFQLLLWRILQKTDSTSGQQAQELFGQCYVALHKIFDIEPSSIEMQDSIQEMRQFSSQDKLWHNGQQIGKGNFKFQVINDKYIKQMQVMLRTQHGIVKYSPTIFTNSQNSSRNSCPELAELIKIQEQIQLSAVQLDRINSEGSSDHPSNQSRKLKVSIQESLEKLLNLLKKSSKNNIVIYAYSSSDQMMRAQELFLNLGLKTIGYLQEEDAHINDLCWEILIALISRGQFLLAHLGFDQKQKQAIKDNRIDKRLQRKIDIALTYHEFLSKYLRIAVDSLSVRGLELQRNFATLFCAYAYFRIPNFRAAILEAFTRQNDPELTQWRGIQFNLQDDIDYDELKQQVNTFTALFDWPNNFHKCLEGFQKYQSAGNDIYEILMREDWKFRLSKRGITFFQFIKCWVEYIESIVGKSKDIQWKYFPGYNKLLKCFLSQMKKRPILEYPDILKASLLKLLSNQKLLNPVVVILFNKANIYQPLTAIRAISKLSEIFKMMSEHNKKMPPTFNYLNFYSGIKIIMESQFSFAISKTIILLYNYFKIFSVQFRRNISMFLLGKVFFKLFLHWSYNVRHVFYHLVMRLYHGTLRIDSDEMGPKSWQQQVNEEVRARYFKLMQILEKTKNETVQTKKNDYFKNIEKDLHKRLKRNLQNKKRMMRKNERKQIETTYQCPDSPASQKIVDNRFVLQDKFSLNQPIKRQQLSRSQSQVLRPSIKLTYKSVGPQKQEQIKVLNKKSNDVFKNSYYDTTKGRKIEMKTSFNDHYGPQYNESDFQIAQIPQTLIGYIDVAMQHFKSTNDLFTKNFNNKDWELPKIQMQMPLDSKQIRPQKIDSW